MSLFRRRKKRDDDATSTDDSLDAFIGQPPQVGTSDADVAAVAKTDAEREAKETRTAQYVKTEEALDRNAPRPSVRH